MYELVLAMVRRLEALSGELRLSTPVERIGVAHGRVWGVETTAGAFTADAVVTDVDERVVRTRLLGRPARRRTPSLSGLALLLGVRDDAPAHHRILFPPDYDAEFDDIFDGQRMPRDPTLYVCAPPGQGWFVLVNAPASPADWDEATAAVLDRLNVRPSVLERVTPADLGGPIYGGAPHGRLGAMRRPGNRIRGVEGLWLTGGTVHPGGGLPLVTLGGRSVARQLSGSRPAHVPSAP